MKIKISSLLYIPIIILILNTTTRMMRYYGLLKWMLGFLCITLIMLKVMQGKKINRLSGENKLWLICVLFMWISSIYSINPDDTISYCSTITIYSLILFVSIQPKFFLKLIDYLYIMLLICMISIFANALIPDLMTNKLSFLVLEAIKPTLVSEVESGIYSGIFADRASAAFAMNLGFAISLAKYKINENHKLIIAMICFYLAVLLTGKRTLAAIPIIMFFAVHLFAEKNKKRRNTYCMLSVLGIFLIVIISRIPAIAERFSRGGEDIWNSRTTVLWPVALEMFYRNKLFGTGLNTFNAIIRGINVSDLTLSTWNYHAHNIYIQFLAELGIVGTLLMVSAFAVMLLQIIKIIKTTKELNVKYLAMISFTIQILWLVYGFTGNTFYYSAQVLCYLIAVKILGVCKNEQKKCRNTNFS